MMKPLPSTTTPVRVREVGLRDGLQILPRVLPTAHKLEWIRAAHAAGLGVPTGLDFDALMALRRQVAQWLDGEPLHGAIWRAGLPKTLLHT